MNLNFAERSFSGKTFRPTPEVFIDPLTNTVIVATSWSVQDVAKKVVNRIIDYISFSKEDPEATSPFPRLTCLTSSANRLRIATLLANDGLYREHNQNEYKAGVELFAAYVEGNELIWLQAGNPQVVLIRENGLVLPLGSQIDHSFDFSNSDQSLLPPLPANMLGLDPTINISVNSFRCRPRDRIVLLSHSHLPMNVFSKKVIDLSIEEISREIGHLHPDTAHWIGVIDIEGESTRGQDHE